MLKQLVALALSGLVVILAGAPLQARDRSGYYEWSTKRPFSGWVGPPSHSYYCDYIKYPVRKCSYRNVCRRGKCRQQENCKVVGWDIRQSCY